MYHGDPLPHNMLTQLRGLEWFKKALFFPLFKPCLSYIIIYLL